ncbi:hypothetical protein LZG74_23535 [Dyadobacter sp. CY327]|uniref:hypothetical protein n=1 Tax=Dyadobacter sp. CY327 TaxID=2907301 RepID=UPI001F239DC3|nr:hypothetical protein [Dyadobacter sp. CY327]MCE7073309.1 hypothetical protein [Dyadobacter sp. CY327]
MVKKILLWIALFLGFKIAVVLIVGLLPADPRRDIATREKHRQAFAPNAVFIGTSRTLYGINPLIFDSLNAGQTRSYNMGLFSLSIANSLNIARHIIENDPKTQIVFIELSALDYSTIHMTPDLVFNDVYFRMRADEATVNPDDHGKWSDFLSDFNTTLFQTFSIAPQIATFKKWINPVNDPIEGPPNLEINGFQDVNLTIPGLNTMVINNRFYTRKLTASSDHPAPNVYFLTAINEVITLGKAYRKRVIFYMPNNVTKGEYELLAQVTPYIPQANFISLPKDPTLEAIFKPGNLFDSHHLNAKGSGIYTRYLYEQFSKKPANF